MKNELTMEDKVEVVCTKMMTRSEYKSALPVMKKRGWTVRAYQKGFRQEVKK